LEESQNSLLPPPTQPLSKRVLALQEKEEALAMTALEHMKWPTCLTGTTVHDDQMTPTFEPRSNKFSGPSSPELARKSAPITQITTAFGPDSGQKHS
jgi:hypothetical protein